MDDATIKEIQEKWKKQKEYSNEASKRYYFKNKDTIREKSRNRYTRKTDMNLTKKEIVEKITQYTEKRQEALMKEEYYAKQKERYQQALTKHLRLWNSETTSTLLIDDA